MYVKRVMSVGNPLAEGAWIRMHVCMCVTLFFKGGSLLFTVA